MPNFPRFEMPDLKIPEIKLPDLKLPQFDLPKVELPDVDLPTAEQVAAFARDAAYVGVGLVVMTAERVQELQQQLLEPLKTQLAEASEQLRSGVDTVVGQVNDLIKR